MERKYQSALITKKARVHRSAIQPIEMYRSADGAVSDSAAIGRQQVNTEPIESMEIVWKTF